MIEINNKTLCENCFKETDLPVCPHCGYCKGKWSKNEQILSPGTVLNGKYIVGKSIGSGGFGITYLGYNISADKKVAIKEYFPKTLVYRKNADTTVMLSNDDQTQNFEKGCDAFYSEAKTLARFNGNPNIVSVYEFFYENGTAYFVMEFLKGRDLRKYIADRGSPLTSEETRKMMTEIASALLITHTLDVLHRDVSNVNIFVCDDGRFKLIDFGSARQYSMEYTKSMSVILNPGFAPLEQYQRHGKQGPWTDIYALGATAYWALTGQLLDDPMTRLNEDKLFNIKGTGIDPALYRIICRCISVDAKGRYRDVQSLLNALKPKAKSKPVKKDKAPKTAKAKLSPVIVKYAAACAAAALLFTVGAVVWFNLPKDSGEEPNPIEKDAYINMDDDSTSESAAETEQAASGDDIADESANAVESNGGNNAVSMPEETDESEGETVREPETEAETAHTHSFGEWQHNGALHTRICSCGERENKNHTYDAGKVTKAPTEGADGIKTFTCTACGANNTEVIPKLKSAETEKETEAETEHNHDFGRWENNGYGGHTRACSCGVNESENHIYDAGKITKVATETAEGVKTYTCTVCGEEKTEAVPKLKPVETEEETEAETAHTHSYGGWTDNKDGSSHSKRCSCGNTVKESHAYDSGRVTKEATDTDEGVKTYTCTVCGAAKTETIPKVKHTHSYDGWVNKGSEHVGTCSCGKTRKEDHTYDSGVETQKPTVSAEGVMTYTCSKCGDVKKEKIPRLDHEVFVYYCYLAEYKNENGERKYIYAYSEQNAIETINRKGWTLVGEIKYMEITLDEKKEDTYEDPSTGIYYYLYDAYYDIFN